MPLDPAAAALLGTVAGGAIGVIGTIINARAAAKQSAADHQRTLLQERLSRTREAYEFGLNVFYNVERAGHPDRATLGAAFARLSLYGSPDVKAALDAYVQDAAHQAAGITERLVRAMQAHLRALEGGQ